MSNCVATIRDTLFAVRLLSRRIFIFKQKEFFEILGRSSEKLKMIANIVFILSIVLASISFIVGMLVLFQASGGDGARFSVFGAIYNPDEIDEIRNLGLMLFLLLPLLIFGCGYICRVFICGFAELVEKTAATNAYIANISKETLPKILKSVETQNKTQEDKEKLE